MRIFLTGCAGFIGAKTAELLLEQGHEVIGVDNLNDAYDPTLKRWRLSQLEGKPNFRFQQVDISAWEPTQRVFEAHMPYDAVVNLAARAGVRQSVQNPWVYVATNTTGALNLLELCRQHGIRKYVLASTSSLYGNNERPFREDMPTDRPLSPYACVQKGRRDDVLHLSSPVRAGHHRIALLHRVRSRRATRYEHLPLHPLD
jgi:UDP-glucuronate 4-epimerase